MTETKTKQTKAKKTKAVSMGGGTQVNNGVFDALFTTEVIVLLDRSGSMGSIKDDMEGGFNQFIAEQRAEPGKCDLTLVQFDTQSIDTVYEATPIADVQDLVLEPRGGTPLLDAMGQTLDRVSKRHEAATQKPDKVLFLVITDGDENSSTKYKRGDIKAMVETQTAKGWVFSFLGANIDSFAEASTIGIQRAATLNYSPDSAGVKGMYSSVSSSLSSLRSGHGYTPLTPTPTIDPNAINGSTNNTNVLPIDTTQVINTTSSGTAQPIRNFRKKST